MFPITFVIINIKTFIVYQKETRWIWNRHGDTTVYKMQSIILRGTSTDVVCFVLSHCHIIYQTICSILHTIYSVYSQLYPVFPEIWLVLFNAKCSRAVPLNHKFLFITHEFFFLIFCCCYFLCGAHVISANRFPRKETARMGEYQRGNGATALW